MNEFVNVADMIKNENGTLDIEISAFIKASPETIYDVLTNRESFAHFMECELEHEIKPGNPIKFTFNVAYTDHNGVTHGPPCYANGEVVKMVPHELFSFTWGDGIIDKEFPAGSTLVEFKIAPASENGADGCRVTIHHYDNPSEHIAKDHTQGWSYHLGNCVQRYA